MKDILKEKHGKIFQDCNFGIENFNKEKRKQTYGAAETLSRNRPTTKGGHTGNASSSVIFLDFTGYIVTGTSWNVYGDIIAAPANLTSAEVDVILANAQGEYAPYNVIVTTDESVYNKGNPLKRMRCIITDSWEWYGTAGGTSYVGSFTWGNDTPCFVFSSLLGYNTKKIKEAVSHEVGHTLGLYHQAVWDANCVKLAEYNSGDGVTGPIMGIPYNIPDAGTKWWLGPNANACTPFQDDNAIIAGVLGLK